MTVTSTPLRWDVFCQVIDNFGDIGVCWRLCADLAERGHQVRLWTDDASALAWMAPQGHPGVQVLPWPRHAPTDGAGDVIVEAFGCEIAPEFIASIAQPVGAGGKKRCWINLEYLSAESYVERCHRLPSPLMSGPAAGMTRWFFYPGFTPATGGLLRERDLLARQAAFDRNAWRATRGLSAQEVIVSLFSYEPPALPALLDQLEQCAQATTAPRPLLVTPGRSTSAMQAAWNTARHSHVPVHYLAPCPQTAFDEMLWACDLNLVRGEDSLVRALWAGEALVWQIYPQHDNAHHDKLHAFLDWLQAPPSLRQFHHAWNSMAAADSLRLPDAQALAEWRHCVRAARGRLLSQPDLLTQLLGFVREKS